MNAPRGDMSLEQVSEQMFCLFYTGFCIVWNSLKRRCSGTGFSVLLAMEMAEAPEQHLFRMEPSFSDPNCSAPFAARY
jgi:hypothetical protein